MRAIDKALEQREKRAAWVPTDEKPHEIYECDACGRLIYAEDITDFKYCPNCGADMRGDTDGNS